MTKAQDCSKVVSPTHRPHQYTDIKYYILKIIYSLKYNIRVKNTDKNICDEDVSFQLYTKFPQQKPTRCTISQLYLVKKSTYFGQIYCPSS
jgi:hypothetical protein